MDSTTKRLAFCTVQWMERQKNTPQVDTENVEVGVQCLSEAFGINVQDAAQRQQLGLPASVSLEQVFTAGLKALGVDQVMASPASTIPSDIDQDPAVQKNPALWKKWLAKLEGKGFFNRAPVGSEEYNSRVKKALLKYKEKFDAPSHEPQQPTLSKAEREAQAEDVKAQGNAALTSGNHERAAELYQQAVELSPDGPNSHIYHSNLAAALLYLGKYEQVIESCEKSIALKPSFVKSYSRMGAAQVHLQDYRSAIDSYRRGLEIDATNVACKEGLAEAERKLRQSTSGATAPRAGAAPSPGGAPGAPGAGGMPDLSSLLGGGGGGLADLMNNPALQQMASSMMQNPAMMQMAQNMMQNPDMMNNMMSSLGGGVGGAGAGAGGAGAGAGAGGAGAGAGTGAGANATGGMPDMSNMANMLRNNPDLQAARSDPDLQEFFRDVETQGPMAAMRHMSNPKVSQLIQRAMGRMQGGA